MQDSTPSRTAWRVAVRRAAHQVLDSPPVFEDPLAVRIVGPDGLDAIERDRVAGSHRVSTALRAFMAVRSRIAEDALADAYARGVRQYIVLGAGLDTFAYRQTFADLRVFEVDHPATQQWKRELLQRADISVPASLEYIAINFERKTLVEGLAESTFDPNAPAFFSWLGVTMYLSRETVLEVFRYIAARQRPSGVAFDYGVARSALGMMERMVLSAFERRVAAIGEPWTCYFDPGELAATLRAAGFADVTDLSPSDINQRYFNDRIDGLQVGTLARVMTAFN